MTHYTAALNPNNEKKTVLDNASKVVIYVVFLSVIRRYITDENYREILKTYL